MRLRNFWIEQEIAERRYRRARRIERQRARDYAYNQYLLDREYAYVLDRQYAYAPYSRDRVPVIYADQGYYRRPSRGVSFSIGSRNGNVVFSIGNYDRYSYAAYPSPVYEPYAYRTARAPYREVYYEPSYEAAPSYRRSSTFNVNIAGAPVTYTQYEEVSYSAPAYSRYESTPAYAETGYAYDPFYAGDPYAIDPYGDFCYPAETYSDYADYDYVDYDERSYYPSPNYSEAVFYDDRRDQRSFYRRHRNLVNIGIATGAGAAIGAIFDGKRGALIGAGVGAGAGAIYTYGINPKDRYRRGI